MWLQTNMFVNLDEIELGIKRYHEMARNDQELSFKAADY